MEAQPQGTGTPPPTAPPGFDPAAAVGQLQQLGYAVYPKGTTLTREQMEADTVLKPVFESVLSERFSQTYQRLDQDILDSTGIAKNPGEKTYDYQKRAAATLKQQIKDAPDVKIVKEGYETRIKDLEGVIKTSAGENAIRAALSTLNLNVPAESLEFMRETLINRAMAMPYRVEGNRVIFQKFGGEDGKTLIDVVNPADGKAMEVAPFLAGEFKSIIKAPEVQAQGSGKSPAAANTNTPVPTTVDEIGQQLTAKGMMPGPAFNAEVKRLQTLYAITE